MTIVGLSVTYTLVAGSMAVGQETKPGSLLVCLTAASAGLRRGFQDEKHYTTRSTYALD